MDLATAPLGSLAIRVIPCLDVKDGRVVKGVNFSGLIDAGDPVELAALYDAQGADELTFLDISASVDDRKTTIEIVKATAEQVFIPLTVGGGIRSIADVDELLRAGADKVSINTAALHRPELIDEIAKTFGSQVLVLSVDARRNDQFKNNFQVTTHGGSRGSERDAKSWIKEALDRGVGEILLNSVDADGTKDGYDEEMIRSLRPITSVPLIASGGAGKISDFSSALTAGADATLAASVFHFGTFTIGEVKSQLQRDGFTVREVGL
jgi:cyclase